MDVYLHMQNNQEKTYQGSSRRIVKNTVFLYMRMIILLVISLYTSRLVLKELGITDYGIYNVIGGLITIFSFINNSMAQASQRFITYEVGKGRVENLRNIFSTCVFIHFILAGIILILGETVGLWYVCNIAVIPLDRYVAALWVYQCSIVVSCATVITVPYNAVIIAHEKMSAFAYITIIEGILKLVIVWLLFIVPSDKLIAYGIMMASLSLLMRVVYGVYSNRNFTETKLLWHIDRNYLKNMGGYAGWSMWGSLAAAGYTQGLNMVLNYFFSPAVNAARGIAVTVQAVIKNFAGNFQVAVNPQITKSYAAGDMDFLYKLIYRASVLSYSLFFIFALPVFLEIDTLLELWLFKVPEYTSVFIRILLLISIVEILASSLNVSMQATGDIKRFEITISIILLLIVPFAYLILKLFPEPANAFWVFFVQVVIAQIARLILVKTKIGLSIRKYLRYVIIPVAFASAAAIVLPVVVHFIMPQNITRLLSVGFVGVIVSPVCFFVFALGHDEKRMVLSEVKKRLKIK